MPRTFLPIEVSTGSVLSHTKNIFLKLDLAGASSTIFDQNYHFRNLIDITALSQTDYHK